MANRIDEALGPSVTPEFAEIVGFNRLASNEKPRTKAAGAQASSAAPATAAPKVAPEAPPIDPKIWRDTLATVDTTVSILADLPSVGNEGGIERKNLDQIADSMLPLVQFYSSKQATVATLWIVASLSMLSYTTVKVQQWRLRKVEKEREADDGRKAKR